MIKDLFIDAEIANKFARPPDRHYQELIDWLLKYDAKNPENNAYLVMSNFLRGEYLNGNQNCASSFSIAMIYAQMQKQGRLLFTSNAKIDAFLKKYVKDKTKKLGLKCNNEDRRHFPLIFFSNRKKALIDDEYFICDVVNFPRLSKGVEAKRKPEELSYK